jgi:hypothetical protein
MKTSHPESFAFLQHFGHLHAAIDAVRLGVNLLNGLPDSLVTHREFARLQELKKYVLPTAAKMSR